MTVKTLSGTASLVWSAGANMASSCAGPDGQDASIILTEGTNSFMLTNDGSENKLAFRDGTHDLLTIARGSGQTYFRGDFTVGGVFAGARSATIKSTDAAASLAVESNGTSAATVAIRSQPGANSVLALQEGSLGFELASGASDTCGEEWGHNHLTVHALEPHHARGDLVIGGIAAARKATVHSVSKVRLLWSRGERGGRGPCEGYSGNDAVVSLTEGTRQLSWPTTPPKTNSWSVRNVLMSLARSTAAPPAGDWTVGASGALAALRCARTTTTRRWRRLWRLRGGHHGRETGRESTPRWTWCKARAPSRHEPRSNKFTLTDGTNSLLEVAAVTGAALARGNLTVGQVRCLGHDQVGESAASLQVEASGTDGLGAGGSSDGPRRPACALRGEPPLCLAPRWEP